MAALLLLLVFLAFATAMASQRLPALVALPAMALALGLVLVVQHGLGQEQASGLLFDHIITQGSVSLSRSMVAALVAGALGQVIRRQGIASALVAVATEYAGERKLPLALALFLVVMVNFMALSGVGAILMTGSVVLPVLISAGIRPVLASTLMLLAIAVGGLLNPLALQIYADVTRVEPTLCRQLALPYAALLLLLSVLFLVIRLRQQEQVFCWAEFSGPDGQTPRLNPLAYLTPLLPLVLFATLGWPPLVSLALATLYGCLVVRPRQWMTTLTASMVEGARDVSGLLVLLVGLGMATQTLSHPLAGATLQPFLQSVSLKNPWTFVACFTVLAPLATYRGPLALYGLGGGVATLLVSQGLLPPIAVLAAFLCLGQVQSVCDPTCTHGLCLAQLVHEPSEKFCREALPVIAVFLLLGLSYASWGQRVLEG